jgi:hypothetical protein
MAIATLLTTRVTLLTDEARVSQALRLALLLSAVVSGLLLGESMLVVWAGRRR